MIQDENPALEMTELPTCPLCGSTIAGNYCTECMPRKGEADDPARRLDDDEARAQIAKDGFFNQS